MRSNATCPSSDPGAAGLGGAKEPGALQGNVRVVILACRQAVPAPGLLVELLAPKGLTPRVVPEPCSSKVEVFQMLRLLAHEADFLWVVGCPESACQLVEGSLRMTKRVAHARQYLEEIGLEKERLGMAQLWAAQAEGLAPLAEEIFSRVQGLGPSRARARTKPGKESA